LADTEVDSVNSFNKLGGGNKTAAAVVGYYYSRIKITLTRIHYAHIVSPLSSQLNEAQHAQRRK